MQFLSRRSTKHCRLRANAPRNFLDLHQAWLSRDLEKLETVVARTPFHRMPQIAMLMVATRNERWLPRIVDATSSSKRTLIAAGAIHLPGKKGLLALLQRAGHRVRLMP
ncbi:MAG: TraB/GumN family protein [Candidatus Binataceae bacterium]